MSWQQIAMIVWMSLAVGLELAFHGEPRSGKHSFWTALIGVGIQAVILYTGGFWG